MFNVVLGSPYHTKALGERDALAIFIYVDPVDPTDFSSIAAMRLTFWVYGEMLTTAGSIVI